MITLPRSIEHEQSLLSAVIMFPDQTLLDSISIVSPQDFYDDRHQKIFAAILSINKAGKYVELPTIFDKLRSMNALSPDGLSVQYIVSLVDSVPAAVDHKQCAQTIKDKAILRGLMATSQKLLERCSKNEDVKEVISFAEKSIYDLQSGNEPKEIVPLSSILDSAIEQIEKRTKGTTPGIPSGFGKLDYLTAGFQDSDLIIIAARPSMGKTAFALNIARNAEKESGKPVVIFSLEMSREHLSTRLLCSDARIDSQRLRLGTLTQHDWEKITKSAESLNDAQILIDDSAGISVTEMMTKCRRLKSKKDIGLIIIDYLQLMRIDDHRERHDLDIAVISRTLKIMAKDLGVPVICLSQLNRKLEERADKRPRLSDLRDSGAIEQDADVVMFIYRDEVYNRDPNNPNRGVAEIIVAKHRNGPTGVATLTFLSSYTRFESLAY